MSDEKRPGEGDSGRPGPGRVDETTPGDGTERHAREAGPGETGDDGEAHVTDALSDAITTTAHRWLRDRLGLEEDDEGQLHLPNTERYADLGERAEEFIKGFFRGFIAKTPEERQIAAGERPAQDAPRATEIMARLVRKVNDTIAGSFYGYLRENAAAESAAEGARPAEGAPGAGEAGADGADAPVTPAVTIDGKFVRQHGAALLQAIVSNLGSSFQGEGKDLMDRARVTPEGAGEAAGKEAAEQAHTVPLRDTAPSSPPAEKVEVEVDMASILKSLVGLK